MTFASILEATGMSAVPVVLFLKATCLLLAALAATFVMMRASSGARHLVWLVVLSSLLLLPAIATWSPLRLELLPRTWASRDSERAASALTNTPASNADANGVASSSKLKPLPLSNPTRDGATAYAYEGVSPAGAPAAGVAKSSSTLGRFMWPVWRATRTVGGTLLLVWLAVTTALLAWLGYGAYSVRRIVRRARPLEAAAWQTPLYEIADRFGLADAPRLVQSDDVRMPFACGMIHPIIVLPAESEGWSSDRRSAVLLHELGHVKRRDLIGHTLGRLACAFYWFHPLVWTAARRLRAESERACDDLALSCGARPSDYAEHLLDIVTCVRNHATPSIALAMAHRKEFEGRMLAILDPELERARPSRRQAASLVGALALLCIVVSAAAPIADAKPVRTAKEQDRPLIGASNAAQDAAQPSTHVTTQTQTQLQTQLQTQMHVQTTLQTNTQPSIPGVRVAAPAVPATPSQDNGAIAIDLIRQGAARLLGSLEPVVSKSLQSAVEKAAMTTPGAAQPRDDERAALLAKVLRTDTSATLRRIAAWGLHEYAGDDVARDALVEAVERDANATVREMAVWSLAEADRSDKVTSTLIAFAKRETDPRPRATALWALGNMGDEKGIDAMIEALGSDNARVRELAVWGIGNMSPRHAPSPLLSALGDKEPKVRLIAAWALYNIEDANAVPALDAQLRKETDHQVQLGLVRALAVNGEKSVEVLKTLIESKDQELRATAIRALAGAGGMSPWPWPWPDPRPYP